MDERLRMIQEYLKEHPEVIITYFQPDDRKADGVYLTITGYVKKIDVYERCVMVDGTKYRLMRLWN